MQVSQWRSAARIDELCQKQVMESRNQFNSCKSTNGGQPLELTSYAKNRSCSLRNQFNSCKSADGGQQLEMTSSTKNKSCSLGNSSTKANRPTNPYMLILTTSPFYSCHAAQKSVQLGQSSPRSLSGLIERSQLYSYPTRTFKLGHVA